MSFTVGQLAKLTGLTVRALHHYHAIGQEYRLGNGVGDEKHGLFSLKPDSLKLKVHLLARHRVQRAEGLIHQ